MQLRYEVTVEVGQTAIEAGKPGEVGRDEIASNLHSVPYVRECTVERLTEPALESTAEPGINHPTEQTHASRHRRPGTRR